jgi:subtilisin family serine protease
MIFFIKLYWCTSRTTRVYQKPALRDACDAAYNAEIVLVAGSGNDGYDYSSWPARFANVISVGGHAEDQTLFDYKGYSSNDGVEFVAPGAKVGTIGPEGSLWWSWGTSMASAYVSALTALQLQYARLNNIDVNNGYLWEVMKHAAVDMPLIPDPVYKGKGKIWAARTLPADPPTSLRVGGLQSLIRGFRVDTLWRVLPAQEQGPDRGASPQECRRRCRGEDHGEGQST